MSQKRRTSKSTKKRPTNEADPNLPKIKIPRFDCTEEELQNYMELLFNECKKHYPALVAKVSWDLIKKNITNLYDHIWAKSKTGPKYMKENKGRCFMAWFFITSSVFTISINLTLQESRTAQFIMACLNLQSTKGHTNKNKKPKTEFSAADIQYRMDVTLPFIIAKYYKVVEENNGVTITDLLPYAYYNLLEWDAHCQSHVLNLTEFDRLMKSKKAKQAPKKEEPGQAKGKREHDQIEEEEPSSSCSSPDGSSSVSSDESDPASLVSVKSRRVTRSTSPRQGIQHVPEVPPAHHSAPQDTSVAMEAQPEPATNSSTCENVMAWLQYVKEVDPEHFARVLVPYLLAKRDEAEQNIVGRQVATVQNDTCQTADTMQSDAWQTADMAQNDACQVADTMQSDTCQTADTTQQEVFDGSAILDSFGNVLNDTEAGQSRDQDSSADSLVVQTNTHQPSDNEELTPELLAHASSDFRTFGTSMSLFGIPSNCSDLAGLGGNYFEIATI